MHGDAVPRVTITIKTAKNNNNNNNNKNKNKNARSGEGYCHPGLVHGDAVPQITITITITKLSEVKTSATPDWCMVTQFHGSFESWCSAAAVVR